MNKPFTYPLSRPGALEQAAIALLGGFLLAAAGALIAFVGFQALYIGRIFPGVSVAGVSVGGLTPQAAADKLLTEVTYPQTGQILFQDAAAQHSWLATPMQLGLFLDADASAQAAFRVGRTGDLWQRLDEQWQARQGGRAASPALIFDQRLATQFLNSIGQEVDRPVIEASLGVQGTEVMVNAGQPGRAVDISATLEALSLQLQSLQSGVVPVVVAETQPVILDASAQAEIARTMLSQNLTIQLPGGETDAGPWVFEPATLAEMLTIERVETETGAQYQVALDSEALITFLANIQTAVARSPENARFIFNDDTRLLEVIQPAVIGRSLMVDESLAAIQQQTTAGQHTVELMIDYINPTITNETTGAELGITELVSSQTSYFRGSSRDRVNNIQIASAQFHGLLIPPGATFSMAEALGDVSLDNGYAEAMIIVGGRTVKGVGGGVCQVSTTLFRTAFMGGYPIGERHAHAYRVYYYEQNSGGYNDALAGLDATVFVPLVDFRFTNDTPYWLLMETYVNPSNYSLTWKFYSTGDGRSVEWHTTGPTNIVEPPEPKYIENPELSEGQIKQVDWEAEGADISVTRIVWRNGEIYFQDSVYTHYQPWQAVYEYGPGTEIPTPEPTPEE